MIATSKFRSEILLKLRRRREGIVRKQFARAAGDADAIARQLDRLRDALSMHSTALQELLAGGGDPMNRRLYSQCIADIRQAIFEHESKLSAATASVEERRTDLTAAMKQRKLLESVKDRQMVRQALELGKADARQRDELHAAHKAATDCPVGEADELAATAEGGKNMSKLQTTKDGRPHCVVSLEFGRRKLRAGEGSELAPGAVVELSAFADDYVDVYADGRLVARGRPIVVDGKLGIRVQEALVVNCPAQGSVR